MNLKQKHTVYNRLRPVNISQSKPPSKTAPSNRNFVKNLNNSSLIASEEVPDLNSLNEDQYYKRTSLFYCSSEEDEKEESLFDTIFEQECSKSMSRKSLTVNLKERKFFKRNVADSPTPKNTVPLDDAEIDDVSKVFKIISKPATFSNCSSTSKTPVKTYCRTKKSKENRDVIETFALPDTPILPGIPLTNNLLDAEAIDASEITFCKSQHLDKPWITSNIEKGTLYNTNYSVLTSTPLSKITVNAVSQPKSSNKRLLDKMKEKLNKILSDTGKLTTPKLKKKSMKSDIEGSVIDSFRMSKSRSRSKHSDCDKEDMSRNRTSRLKHATYSNDVSKSSTSTNVSKSGTKSKHFKIDLETDTTENSQRKLRSSGMNESQEISSRRGRSPIKKKLEQSTTRMQLRSRSSDRTQRPNYNDFRRKLRSRSQEPEPSFQSQSDRELQILLSPLKKGKVLHTSEDLINEKSSFEIAQFELRRKINLDKILSDWGFKDTDYDDAELLVDSSIENVGGGSLKKLGMHTKPFDLCDQELEIVARRASDLQVQEHADEELEMNNEKEKSGMDEILENINKAIAREFDRATKMKEMFASPKPKNDCIENRETVPEELRQRIRNVLEEADKIEDVAIIQDVADLEDFPPSTNDALELFQSINKNVSNDLDESHVDTKHKKEVTVNNILKKEQRKALNNKSFSAIEAFFSEDSCDETDLDESQNRMVLRIRKNKNKEKSATRSTSKKESSQSIKTESVGSAEDVRNVEEIEQTARTNTEAVNNEQKQKNIDKEAVKSRRGKKTTTDHIRTHGRTSKIKPTEDEKSKTETETIGTEQPELLKSPKKRGRLPKLKLKEDHIKMDIQNELEICSGKNDLVLDKTQRSVENKIISKPVKEGSLTDDVSGISSEELVLEIGNDKFTIQMENGNLQEETRILDTKTAKRKGKSKPKTLTEGEEGSVERELVQEGIENEGEQACDVAKKENQIVLDRSKDPIRKRRSKKPVTDEKELVKEEIEDLRESIESEIEQAFDAATEETRVLDELKSPIRKRRSRKPVTSTRETMEKDLVTEAQQVQKGAESEDEQAFDVVEAETHISDELKNPIRKRKPKKLKTLTGETDLVTETQQVQEETESEDEQAFDAAKKQTRLVLDGLRSPIRKRRSRKPVTLTDEKGLVHEETRDIRESIESEDDLWASDTAEEETRVLDALRRIKKPGRPRKSKTKKVLVQGAAQDVRDGIKSEDEQAFDAAKEETRVVLDELQNPIRKSRSRKLVTSTGEKHVREGIESEDDQVDSIKSTKRRGRSKFKPDSSSTTEERLPEDFEKTKQMPITMESDINVTDKQSLDIAKTQDEIFSEMLKSPKKQGKFIKLKQLKEERANILKNMESADNRTKQIQKSIEIEEVEKILKSPKTKGRPSKVKPERVRIDGLDDAEDSLDESVDVECVNKIQEDTEVASEILKSNKRKGRHPKSKQDDLAEKDILNEAEKLSKVITKNDETEIVNDQFVNNVQEEKSSLLDLLKHPKKRGRTPKHDKMEETVGNVVLDKQKQKIMEESEVIFDVSKILEDTEISEILKSPRRKGRPRSKPKEDLNELEKNLVLDETNRAQEEIMSPKKRGKKPRASKEDHKVEKIDKREQLVEGNQIQVTESDEFGAKTDDEILKSPLKRGRKPKSLKEVKVDEENKEKSLLAEIDRAESARSEDLVIAQQARAYEEIMKSPKKKGKLPKLLKEDVTDIDKQVFDTGKEDLLKSPKKRGRKPKLLKDHVEERSVAETNQSKKVLDNKERYIDQEEIMKNHKQNNYLKDAKSLSPKKKESPSKTKLRISGLRNVRTRDKKRKHLNKEILNKNKLSKSNQQKVQSVISDTLLSPRRGRSLTLKMNEDKLKLDTMEKAEEEQNKINGYFSETDVSDEDLCITARIKKISPVKEFLSKVTKINSSSVKVNLAEVIENMETTDRAKINNELVELEKVAAVDGENEQIEESSIVENSDRDEIEKEKSSELVLQFSQQNDETESLADELDIATIEADVSGSSHDLSGESTSSDSAAVSRISRSKSRLSRRDSSCNSRSRGLSRSRVVEDGEQSEKTSHRLFRSKSSLGFLRNRETLENSDCSEDSEDSKQKQRPRSKSVVPHWILWKKVVVRDFQTEMKNKKGKLLKYKLGELVWAQFSQYPYWPGVITRDSKNKQFRKIVIRRNNPFIYCHVMFLGDNCQTAWISENKIIFYKSKDDLTIKCNTERAEGKINSDASYLVRDRFLKKWEVAVREADLLKNKTLSEKLKMVKWLLVKSTMDSDDDELTNENIINILNKKKREISSKTPIQSDVEEQRPAQKKIKLIPKRKPKKEPENTTVNKEMNKSSEEDSKLVKNKTSQDTVVLVETTSPKKDAKTTESPKKDPKPTENQNSSPTKYPEPIEPPYVPILDNENILPSRLRVRRIDETPETPPKSTESSSDDLYSVEMQKALFKRNNLFKGVSKDKVCQYCFLLGETYKCKGCNGFYHLTCATEVTINKPFHLRGKKKRSLSPSVQDDNKSDNSFINETMKLEDDMKPEETESKDQKLDGLCSDDHVQIITVTSNIFNTPPRKTFPEHFRDMSLVERIDFKMKEVMEKFESKMIYIEGSTELSSDDCLNKQSNKSLEVSSTVSGYNNVVKSIEETVKLRHEAKVKQQISTEMRDLEVKPLSTSLGKLVYPSIRHVTADSDVADENTVPNNKVAVKHVTADAVSFELIVQNEKSGKLIKRHVTADGESFELTPSESSCSSASQKDKINAKHFKCAFCLNNTSPFCFVCNLAVSMRGSEIRQKCSLYQCGRFYHPECLKLWPQTQWSIIQTTKHKLSQSEMDSFVCPQHVCHTCASDDPRAATSRCSGDKIVKCLRCPSSYHSTNFCVPAGTEILSATQIICPRHRNKVYTINTTWCFLCNEGGNLICCENCPTSVHPECMPVNLTEDDKFICEDCESGRLPLYDEIVWVKLGKYKWWPGLILFPNEVPLNVRNIKHSVGEFVVRFFGTYDYYWVNRGRSFLFQEGDNGQTSSNRKEDKPFLKAVNEAVTAHKKKKEFKRTQEAETINSLKPPPYIRIKFNKAVGNVKLLDLDLSNTTPCDCNPNQMNPCGPDSNCLNRLLLTECNPEICPAGSRCQNQSFEKREYPPMTPYKTPERGWGLKALAAIKKGQFVIEYVGELIDEAEYQRRIQKMHEQKEENYYFLTIDKDRMIDAGPKGNMARFMNHCCQPNCETQKWTVNGDTRVGLFASVDIPAGTELTFNYNLECIGKEKKVCRCGAPNCSGFIGVKSKQENEVKKSKKVLKKKKLVEQTTLPPCFICKRKSNVALCNNKICNKAYHLKCLNISEWPDGNKFVCPWHNCNTCSKRTIRCCVKCINSFCPSHSEGNVRYDNLLGFVCNIHDPTKPSHQESPVKARRQRDVITDESAVTSTTSDDSEEDEEMPLSERLCKRRFRSRFPEEEDTESEANDSQDEYEVSSASCSNVDRVSKRKRTIRREVQGSSKRLKSEESQSFTATSDVNNSEGSVG